MYGIYHLLKGKKSSQTIQDAKLYKTTFLFSAMSDLKRRDIEQLISELKQSNMIKEEKKDTYALTKSGEQKLFKEMENNPFPLHLNGWKYGTISSLLWKRLALLIQVLSHLLIENKNFFPIIKEKEIMYWIKNYLLHAKYKKNDLAIQLHSECKKILSQLHKNDANIFVFRLSGTNRIGLTFKQIGDKLNMEEDKVKIHFIAALHFFIKSVQEKPTEFPVLYSLMRDIETPIPLMKSTLETYSLLKLNKSIEEIMKTRDLKRGTVEDHIVEIALYDPSFNIDRFVPKKLFDEINESVKSLGTRKMKPIKEKIGDSVSYFQIRLVVAKEGDFDES